MFNGYRITVSNSKRLRAGSEFICESKSQQVVEDVIARAAATDKPWSNSFRRSYIYTIACSLPAWEEARRQSNKGWEKVPEAEVFPSSEDMERIFGPGN